MKKDPTDIFLKCTLKKFKNNTQNKIWNHLEM